MELKVPIPVTPNNRFKIILQLLSPIPPFSKLRPRELEVYGELLYYYDKWKDLPEKERNTLIFDYQTRIEISDKLKMSVDNLYTVMQGLKKNNLIIGTKGKDVINPVYADRFNNPDKVIFILVEKPV